MPLPSSFLIWQSFESWSLILSKIIFFASSQLFAKVSVHFDEDNVSKNASGHKRMLHNCYGWCCTANKFSSNDVRCVQYCDVIRILHVLLLPIMCVKNLLNYNVCFTFIYLWLIIPVIRLYIGTCNVKILHIDHPGLFLFQFVLIKQQHIFGSKLCI